MWKINFNKTRVTDNVITCDKTEYSSDTLAEVVDGEKVRNKIWAQDPGLISNEYTKIDKWKMRIKENN